MKRLIVTLTLIVVFASFIGVSNVKVIETKEFNDVKNLVAEKVQQYGEFEVLVVLDIDNTILTSQVDLGGDIWYQWQRKKISGVIPDSNQIVDCLFEGAIGLLYELGTMELTEDSVPKYIKKWQESSITVFALTSRDPKYRTPTERELAKRNIDFSATGLRPECGSLPVLRYKLDKELSYMNGIMMTTGMDKGKMLKHILEEMERSFKCIIFVDDSEKNVVSVKNSYISCRETEVNIFHYTKIEDDRIALTDSVLTKGQADKMAKDWKALDSLLKKTFPGRDVKDGCVSPN